jgi:hypothetical protein
VATAPRKTSATFVPSPLSNALPPSASSPASIPGPAFIKKEDAPHATSPTTQNNARDVDVEMTDAAPDESIEHQNGQGPAEGHDGAYQRPGTETKAHNFTTTANMTSDTVMAPLAPPQRAFAEIDAAELLLGLRET